MQLKNNIYNIVIEEDSTYTIDSTDNKFYEITFNPFELKKSDNYTAFSININNGVETSSCILIGHNPAYSSSCAVLDDNMLNVLMRDEIIQIDIKQCIVNNIIHINSTWPVLYELKNYMDGYIVFGELDVIKLSHKFELQWDFSTPDVITEYSINDKNEILIGDWNHDCYRLNSLGEEIK